MLKNSELNDISKSIALLETIKIYLAKNNIADFIDKTGIDLIDIQQSIKALQHIHTKDTIRHKEYSIAANKWNKAHPEEHRKHSREAHKKHPRKEYQHEYYIKNKSNK